MEQSRTKVAAAAASVIPFSCVICFDEFNTTERPPMVLPCGHTYVCLCCTKRLRRCMECREPLFWKPTAGTATTHSQQSANTTTTTCNSRCSTGRFSPNTQQLPSTPTKQKPALPIPLPIPKNVVLLAMMEAAERQQQKYAKHQHKDDDGSTNTLQEDDDNDNDDDEEEEAFNLDHIITGMATLSGPCGTYAVREPDGLPLYSYDPRRQPKGPPESVLLPEIPTEPTNSLLDEEKKQDEGTMEAESVAKDEDEEDEVEVEEEQPNVLGFVLRRPFRNMESVEILVQGQKLQVVSWEDGVAKLARGRGYVQATSKQLVKVGGPLDEACRLEGLLDTVRSRGEDLQKTLQENHEIEEKLHRQLQEAQAREPAHPVISEPPQQQVPEPFAHSPETTPSTPPVQRCLTTPEKRESHPADAHLEHREQFYTPRNDYGRFLQGLRREPHSPASIDNSDIMTLPGPAMPRYGSSVSFEEQENHHPLGGGFACGVALSLEGAEDFIHRPQPSRPHFRSSASPDHSSLTPSLTSSFDGVDFRTGLSGHRGLSNARRLHNSPKPRSQIRMMGEHRGIAHIRPRRECHGTSSTGTILENSPTFICSPTTTTSTRPQSAVPALGPRFSSPGS